MSQTVVSKNHAARANESKRVEEQAKITFNLLTRGPACHRPWRDQNQFAFSPHLQLLTHRRAKTTFEETQR
jgi:hypothetical protein